jgi:hypothetical protein
MHNSYSIRNIKRAVLVNLESFTVHFDWLWKLFLQLREVKHGGVDAW